MTKSTSIPPKLLHKHLADDVLLANPRSVLPAEIRGELKNGFNCADSAGLSRLYCRSDPSGYALLRPGAPGDAIGLPSHEPHTPMAFKGTPHQVIAKLLESSLCLDLPATHELTDDAIETFLAHHCVEKRSTSFTLVNQANHYFFYRKPHEHVPGIMLLEAARQATYYQLYEHSGYALGEVTVSLSELHARFHAYGELMHPIEIVVDDLTDSHSPRPRAVRYLASFYQKGALIAEVETQAPVIRLDKFKTARNALFSNDERFAPLPGAPVLTLIATTDNDQEIVQLIEIGSRYCVTTRPKRSNVQHGHLSVIFDGDISFIAPIHREAEDQANISWRLGPLQYKQHESLKEIIKRGFIAIGDQPSEQGAR